MKMELKVLTLNAWGLFVVSKHIKERLRAIADEIPEYDVVCLQEVWSREDYGDLVSRVSSKMPYYHHFKSAIIGSGLCIFSKYPIVSAIGHEYRVSLGMRRVQDGDVFAGKGALCCKIDTPSGIIAVYTTHTTGKRKPSHLLELMQFVRHTRSDHPVIITGDFNTTEKQTAFQLMTKCLGMADVFHDEPEAHTCGRPSAYCQQPGRGKRIDFIFYSDEFCGCQTLRMMSRKLVLTENIPGRNFPFSDHAGIEAVFQFLKHDGQQTYPGVRSLTMKDPALNVLRKISADIHDQMSGLYKFDVEKHGKLVIAGLISALLLIYLCMAVLNELLYAYHIHWVTMLMVSITGALLMLLFFFLMNEMQLYSGMTANIDEINTILAYHTAERENNDDTRILFSS